MSKNVVTTDCSVMFGCGIGVVELHSEEALREDEPDATFAEYDGISDDCNMQHF